MDWRDDASNLSELADRLYSMPGKLLYTDVTFVLSDCSQVEAHKLLLALASPVFEMEFMSDIGWREAVIELSMRMTWESFEN